MPGDIQFVQCNQCGKSLDEPPGLSPEGRTPCPLCGSTSRKFGVDIHSELTPRAMLSFKGRHVGGGRPFVKGKVDSDLHRKSGRWMRLERIIDRAKDWYREHISDRATGNVSLHVEEPLSQHREHGAAKKHVEPSKCDA